MGSLKRAILQDWLPAMVALILLHVPNREPLTEGAAGAGASGPAMGTVLGGGASRPEGRVSSQGTSPATFHSPVNSGAGIGSIVLLANLSAVANNSYPHGGTGFGSYMTTGSSSSANVPQSSRDLEQESVYAGACIALASLYTEVAALDGAEPLSAAATNSRPCTTAGSTAREDLPGGPANNAHLALRNLLRDTALVLADRLSDECRVRCIYALRDAMAARDGLSSSAGGGNLHPDIAYILSCPVSASVYYPRLILERLPQLSVFGRPMPAPPPRDVSSGHAGGDGAAHGHHLKRMASTSFGGMFGPNAVDHRPKRVRFGLKTWDAVSDPSPAVQDNDTAVNLWLLEATKVVRQRRR